MPFCRMVSSVLFDGVDGVCAFGDDDCVPCSKSASKRLGWSISIYGPL